MIYTNEMIKAKSEKRKRIKKILMTIWTPIIVFILISCTYVYYQKFVQKKDNIEFFGYTAYIVLTGSMEPEIHPGDMIISKKVEQAEINEGDIISFSLKNENAVVTHRVIEKVQENGNTYYRTKGDNNNVEDPELVNYEDIQGTKAITISKVGRILASIATEGGIALFIIIMLINYTYSNNKRDKIMAREEARKRYNIPKYNVKEENVL